MAATISAVQATRPLDRAAFQVAIICALSTESDAVEAVFDTFWDDTDEHSYGKAAGDFNSYTLGRIGRHDVVLAYMPGMGQINAANVAANFRASFPNIRLGLVVGICGAVPRPTGYDNEIFLGDVVISTELIQSHFGRQYDDKFERKDTLQDNMGRPNAEIRGFITQLRGLRGRSNLQKRLMANVDAMCRKRRSGIWNRPRPEEDKLYNPSYRHKHQEAGSCDSGICAQCLRATDPVCEASRHASCAALKCDPAQIIPATERRRGIPEFEDRIVSIDDEDILSVPIVHFGPIASSDSVVRSAHHRDEIAARERVLAFEMEGAGVWDNFPTIIIKATCDYADSHKNKAWQLYAAVVAAACTKAVLADWRGVDRATTSGSDSQSGGSRFPAAIFNNHGTVQNQTGVQNVHGSMFFGPTYHQIQNTPFSGSSNWGSQVGTNYGQVNNHYMRRPETTTSPGYEGISRRQTDFSVEEVDQDP